jgi:SSS family solute:Na+ symporter
MIVASFLTQRNSKLSLNRFYLKMSIPVDADPKRDLQNLNQAYSGESTAREEKWFPNTEIELLRPTKIDVIGFIGTFAICFGVIGLAMWLASIGS